MVDARQYHIWRQIKFICTAVSESQKRLKGLSALTWTTLVLEASRWLMPSIKVSKETDGIDCPHLNYYGSGGIPMVDARHQSLKRDWWEWGLHFTFCILHLTTKVLEASQWMMMSRDLKTDQTYVLLHRSLRRDWREREIRFRRKVPTALWLVERRMKVSDWLNEDLWLVDI